MFELAFIQQCADPEIEIAIVERFVAEVGTDNPLAVTITSGNRLILPEPPSTPEEAMRLIERFVAQAVVRVGVTHYPAGHGIADASALDSGMVDACENIRMGSALFGKVYRVVAHARGDDSNAVFREAVDAWRTGVFEGRYAFGEPDPGPLGRAGVDATHTEVSEVFPEMGDTDPAPAEPAPEPADALDPYQAGIRIDLSGIQ